MSTVERDVDSLVDRVEAVVTVVVVGSPVHSYDQNQIYVKKYGCSYTYRSNVDLQFSTYRMLVPSQKFLVKRQVGQDSIPHIANTVGPMRK